MANEPSQIIHTKSSIVPAEYHNYLTYQLPLHVANTYSVRSALYCAEGELKPVFLPITLKELPQELYPEIYEVAQAMKYFEGYRLKFSTVASLVNAQALIHATDMRQALISFLQEVYGLPMDQFVIDSPTFYALVEGDELEAGYLIAFEWVKNDFP